MRSQPHLCVAAERSDDSPAACGAHATTTTRDATNDDVFLRRRGMTDLHQLGYLPGVAAAHRAALGPGALGDVDAPLPRDGMTRRHAVGGGGALPRVVKHDAEGHAIGAALKARGVLHETVLGDLLGGRGSCVVSWEGGGGGVGT
jgi:hypothetical protein